MVSAVGPSVFKNGEGCGTCFEVKCSSNAACSGKPVRVVVIDICPGGPCVAEAVHFDLSGHAFGALAVPGKAEQLRGVGNLKIDYRRYICLYIVKYTIYLVHIFSSIFSYLILFVSDRTKCVFIVLIGWNVIIKV